MRGCADGGLFVGLDLGPPFKALQAAAAARGLLLISAGDNTVRLAPALNIGEADVKKGLDIMDAALADAYPAPWKHAQRAVSDGPLYGRS